MPEDRCLVPQLTVEENIMLPLWVARHLDRKVRLDFVYEVIGELTEMRQRKALLLSGGQQKLVALGRALAIGTRCLLLDEPFEGIAPALSERLSEVLASLRGKDLTLLMSQSDMNHSRGLIDVEFTIERGANLAIRHSVGLDGPDFVGRLGNARRRREVRYKVGADEFSLRCLRYPSGCAWVADRKTDQRDHEKDGQRKQLDVPVPIDAFAVSGLLFERAGHGCLQFADVLPGRRLTAEHPRPM